MGQGHTEGRDKDFASGFDAFEFPVHQSMRASNQLYRRFFNSAPLDPDKIHGTDLKIVATDSQKVRRNIPRDARRASDERHCSDGTEVMHDAVSRNDGMIVDMHVTAEHRGISDNDPVPEDTIVSDVTGRHEVTAMTDLSEVVFFLCTAVDCDTFAKCVPVADSDQRRSSLIGDILRLFPDRAVREELVVATDGRMAGDADMTSQDCSGTDFYIRADEAERADFHIGIEFRSGLNHR